MSPKRQRNRYDVYVAILEPLHTRGSLSANEIASSADLHFSGDDYQLIFLLEKKLITRRDATKEEKAIDHRVRVKYEITTSGRMFLWKMGDALRYLSEQGEKTHE